MAAILGYVTEICMNRITYFLLFILTWFILLLIFLMKIVDFEKKSVQFARELGILLAFQNLQ